MCASCFSTKFSARSSFLRDKLAKLDQFIAGLNKYINAVVKQFFTATKCACFEVILPTHGPIVGPAKVVHATKVVVVHCVFAEASVKYFEGRMFNARACYVTSRDHHHTKFQGCPRRGQDPSPKRENRRWASLAPVTGCRGRFQKA
jgi:hypothetical protein